MLGQIAVFHLEIAVALDAFVFADILEPAFLVQDFAIELPSYIQNVFEIAVGIIKIQSSEMIVERQLIHIIFKATFKARLKDF
jgi:hypothetical protein